ncbi:MAG: ABC transporter permease [Myxococcaceae bacterium]|nr:ABC transporter permease [Myxococcaceae bacterium]MCI0673089.1 ABC transporter permease [Myxococcaceae bacterium]
MTPLLMLAVRNVARSKARSAITVGAITLGILMTLLLGAVIHGLHRWLIEDTVKGTVGAIQVHRTGYFERRDRQPLKLDLEEGGAVEAAMLRVPGVAAVTPRLAFSGMVSNGSSATIFVAQGVDPVREKQVLPWASQDVRGTRLGADTPRSTVLAKDLAEALGVEPGATLTLQATTQGGKENVLDVELGGMVTSSLMAQSKRMLSVPLPFAQELVRMKGRATEYVVAVDEGADVDQVATGLRAALGAEFDVQTWREVQPAVPEVIAIQRGVLLAIGALFLVIAIIGVANTLLMSVLERTREIGTMMAVGVKRQKIAVLFVLEAAVQALIGAAVGVAGAYGIVALVLARGGLSLQVTPTQLFTIQPEVAGYQVAIAVVASTVGAVLAAVSPALRAARLRPVEALRDA